MPTYRRALIPGGTYFFTLVSGHRMPILVTEEARAILHCAWKDVQQRFPFSTVAICLLPDHLHCIWNLPEGDSNYSIRWKEIKRLFSRNYMTQAGVRQAAPLRSSQAKREETGLWQRRFWEHSIQDEDDLRRHIDYIHYNPVKHAWATRVKDWPWSSFHRYVERGYYDIDWGEGDERNCSISFGE
jgi:putative transposase